jgi:hypothetical protein
VNARGRLPHEPLPGSPLTQVDERAWTLVRLSNSEAWCIAAGEVEARDEGIVDVASGIIVVESVPVVPKSRLVEVERERDGAREDLESEIRAHGLGVAYTEGLDVRPRDPLSAGVAREAMALKRYAEIADALRPS